MRKQLVCRLILSRTAVRCFFFFFSSRRRHTRLTCDWSSDVCSSDLECTSALHARLHEGRVVHVAPVELVRADEGRERLLVELRALRQVAVAVRSLGEVLLGVNP